MFPDDRQIFGPGRHLGTELSAKGIGLRCVPEKPTDHHSRRDE